MKFSRPLIKAFLIFPVNVMGVIPALLVWCSRPGGVLERFPYSFSNVRSLAGMLLISVGVGLCWKTVSLFTEYGEGTPAPFDPPRKLVIQGPYIYMRNPMMVAVCLVLSGEALLFASALLGLWFLFFFGLCLILIPPPLAHWAGGQGTSRLRLEEMSNGFYNAQTVLLAQ